MQEITPYRFTIQPEQRSVLLQPRSANAHPDAMSMVLDPRTADGYTLERTIGGYTLSWENELQAPTAVNVTLYGPTQTVHEIHLDPSSESQPDKEAEASSDAGGQDGNKDETE